MKFVERGRYVDPDLAARKLVEIGIGAVTPYCAAEVAAPLSLWAMGAAK